jgi:hypothetical protein
MIIIPACETAEAIGDALHNPIASPVQGVADSLRVAMSLIDDEAPIDGHEDPAGRVAIAGREAEHGHVENGGLAAGGGQRERVGPGALAHGLGEPRLPWEWLESMDSVEECSEVRSRVEFGHESAPEATRSLASWVWRGRSRP